MLYSNKKLTDVLGKIVHAIKQNAGSFPRSALRNTLAGSDPLLLNYVLSNIHRLLLKDGKLFKEYGGELRPVPSGIIVAQAGSCTTLPL